MLQRISHSAKPSGTLIWLRLSLISFALGRAALPSIATADEVNWGNAAGGNYFTGANWSGGAIPEADDGVVFDLGSPGYVVTSASDIETASLTVRSDNVTLSLDDNTWLLPSTLVTTFVGRQAGDSATLTLTSGRLESGAIRVGYQGNSEGTLIIEGSTAHLLSINALYAGGEDTSRGNITIRDGARVSLPASVNPNIYIGPTEESSGNVVITGANTRLEVAHAILVGERGVGSFEVRDSASIAAMNLVVGGTSISGNAQAHGTALIQDSEASFGGQIILGLFGSGKLTLDNSTVTNQVQVQVGGPFGTTYGHGELVIENGATLESFKGSTITSATVAAFAPSSSGSVLVTGAGSRWLQDGNFSVGSVGAGTLRIEEGGYVESKDAQVARLSTASADVQVDGAGSEWVVQDRLIIGGAFAASGGVATVDVSNHGRVEARQQLHLWEQGTLDVSQQGAVVVGDFAAPIASTVLVNSGGTLSGTGNIIGDVIVAGGTLAPGASPGVLHIDGNFESNGQLQLDLGPIGFDQLQVSGDVTLDGVLQLNISTTFEPSIDDEFRVLDAAAVTGRFSQLANYKIGDQLQFAPFIDTTGVTLRVVLSGDATLDHLVDGADYTVWADNYLSTNAKYIQADFNNDGLVDGADYTIWADHFLESAGHAHTLGSSANGVASVLGRVTAGDGVGPLGQTRAGIATVPEPESLVLATIGVIVGGSFLARRRVHQVPRFSAIGLD